MNNKCTTCRFYLEDDLSGVGFCHMLTVEQTEEGAVLRAGSDSENYVNLSRVPLNFGCTLWEPEG